MSISKIDKIKQQSKVQKIKFEELRRYCERLPAQQKYILSSKHFYTPGIEMQSRNRDLSGIVGAKGNSVVMKGTVDLKHLIYNTL